MSNAEGASETRRAARVGVYGALAAAVLSPVVTWIIGNRSSPDADRPVVETIRIGIVVIWNTVTGAADKVGTSTGGAGAASGDVVLIPQGKARSFSDGSTIAVTNWNTGRGVTVFVNGAQLPGPIKSGERVSLGETDGRACFATFMGVEDAKGYARVFRFVRACRPS